MRSRFERSLSSETFPETAAARACTGVLLLILSWLQHRVELRPLRSASGKMFFGEGTQERGQRSTFGLTEDRENSCREWGARETQEEEGEANLSVNQETYRKAGGGPWNVRTIWGECLPKDDLKVWRT